MQPNNQNDPFASIDDEALMIQRCEPGAGEKVNVGNIPGWYGPGVEVHGRKDIGGSAGDTFFRTSSAGHSIAGLDAREVEGAPAITATPFESACQRARRLGGIDFETKLVPAMRADFGDTDVDRFYVVRKDTSAAIGLVGRVAAQHTKGEPAHEVNPAPPMLQPSALDCLDSLSTSEFWKGIDRGGNIGGSIPWIQARPIECTMPNGDTFHVRPMVSNPLDGTGSFFFALPGSALSCRNIYVSILGSRRGVLKIRHSASGEDMLKRIRKTLEIVAESLPKRLALVAKMASVQVSEEWLTGTFLPAVLDYVPGTPYSALNGKKRNRYDAIMGFYRSAPGADPGTGWGALQAVTYLTTHHYRGTAGKTGPSTEEQLYKGAAGALEERATLAVQRLALSPDERRMLVGVA